MSFLNNDLLQLIILNQVMNDSQTTNKNQDGVNLNDHLDLDTLRQDISAEIDRRFKQMKPATVDYQKINQEIKVQVQAAMKENQVTDDTLERDEKDIADKLAIYAKKDVVNTLVDSEEKNADQIKKIDKKVKDLIDKFDKLQQSINFNEDQRKLGPIDYHEALKDKEKPTLPKRDPVNEDSTYSSDLMKKEDDKVKRYEDEEQVVRNANDKQKEIDRINDLAEIPAMYKDGVFAGGTYAGLSKEEAIAKVLGTDNEMNEKATNDADNLVANAYTKHDDTVSKEEQTEKTKAQPVSDDKVDKSSEKDPLEDDADDEEEEDIDISDHQNDEKQKHAALQDVFGLD